MTAKKGDKVKVEYTGTFEDGKVFDKGPLEFEIGAGQLIPGFDNAVIGMKPGQEKNVKIKPVDAYGEVDPRLVQKAPANQLPAGAKEGMMLMINLPNGMKIPAKIVGLTDAEATLDMNHPLAGKTLNFKIKLVSIG
jgi:peptidylprolyl isomerase